MCVDNLLVVITWPRGHRTNLITRPFLDMAQRDDIIPSVWYKIISRHSPTKQTTCSKNLLKTIHNSPPFTTLSSLFFITFIHLFIPDISIAPFQVHYYSEAL